VLRRSMRVLVALPVAIVLVTLAVANRHGVRLVLDPFRPDDPVVSLVLPFYAYLFAALFIGVLIGGSAAWLAQSRWRRAARRRAADAVRWQAEADRLARERDRQLSAAVPLAPAPR
jgi:hypothetical protein